MSKEIKLTRESFLVSYTDKKGVVLFANRDFCEISGFSINELIGQNHNIVRHPDMPKAAFKDLWETIKQNKIWTGYVKNKSKNGDFYWVFATIYSIDNGYLSCRRKASDKEIEDAIKLYSTMS